MKPQYEDTAEAARPYREPTACRLACTRESSRGNMSGIDADGKHALVRNRLGRYEPVHVADLVKECPGPREQCTGNLVRTEPSSNGTRGDSQSPRNNNSRTVEPGCCPIRCGSPDDNLEVNEPERPTPVHPEWVSARDGASQLASVVC